MMLSIAEVLASTAWYEKIEPFYLSKISSIQQCSRSWNQFERQLPFKPLVP